MDTTPDDDLNLIATKLSEAFGASTYHITRDPQGECVFIAIPGLDKYPESRIEAIAGPLLDELDLEYEEIVLISA